jgi:hypothetical protein
LKNQGENCTGPVVKPNTGGADVPGMGHAWHSLEARDVTACLGAK